MVPRRSVLSLAGVTLVSAGCADLLGYDEYSARAPDATTVVDTAVDVAVVDTSVSDADAGEQPIHPPPRPAGPIAPSGKGRTVWFVMDRFFLAQEVGGGSSDKPWRRIGYDIDNVCTGERESRENIGTCRRPTGADQMSLLDGDRCRDNNFGSQIIPLVSAFDSEFEKIANEQVKKGASTWLLKLEDLDDGPDDPYVVGKLYRAATWWDYGTSAPRFDGTDVRDVEEDSVWDGDLDKPKTLFASGWLAGNVFVSGEPSKFEITLPIQSTSIRMPVVGAVVTLRLDAMHEVGEAGVMGGAVPGAAVETVFRPIAELTGVCPGAPLYDSFIRSFARMMDVVADAPNLQDTTLTCDAISIGIGVTAVRAQPPSRVVRPYVKPSICDDAGTSG